MKNPLHSSARGASFHTKHASNADIIRVVLFDANSYIVLRQRSCLDFTNDIVCCIPYSWSNLGVSEDIVSCLCFWDKAWVVRRYELSMKYPEWNSRNIYKSHPILKAKGLAIKYELTLCVRFPSIATTKPTPQASCSFWGSYKPCLGGPSHSIPGNDRDRLHRVLFSHIIIIKLPRTRDWPACVKIHAGDDTQFRVSDFYGLRDNIDNR
jgi:hypothetical protein